MTATLSVLILVLAASDAAAQPPPKLPRWDVAAGAGVFVGHPDESVLGDSFDDWYHTATLGVVLGHYVTPNLKVEGEVTISGEGSRYGVQTSQVPALGPYAVSVEQRTRTQSASGALVWQFFDNRWVHPFLMAGLTLDLERERLHTWPQPYYGGFPRAPGGEIVPSTDRVEPLGTTRHVRALVGGGAKLYVAERAFFRTETRIGIGSADSMHVAFRLGFGVDF